MILLVVNARWRCTTASTAWCIIYSCAILLIGASFLLSQNLYYFIEKRKHNYLIKENLIILALPVAHSQNML